MRFKCKELRSFISSNSGPLLMLFLCLYTYWLVQTEQLRLYIHPRYELFTIIMINLGTIGSVLAILRNTSTCHHQTEAAGRLYRYALSTLAVIFLLSMAVIKPRILTSATVDQRGLNNASLSIQSTSALQAFGGDFSNLGVKDWSSLLGQTQDPAYFAGKTADITGFVTTTPDSPAEVFYASRFIVTCCAVDARPVGVPVHIEGWQDKYRRDTWVQIRGEFKPVTFGDKTMLVLEPQLIEPTGQPKDPYAY